MLSAEARERFGPPGGGGAGADGAGASVASVARGGGGGGRQPQRIIVQQQPPWSGPPVPPIKIAGQPLPGAANAVFILGFGLAAIAVWNTVLVPGWDKAWNGNKATHKFQLPAQGQYALVFFVLLLVFIASLSPGSAQVVLYLMLALWAVFLVMKPNVLSTVLGWISQQKPTQSRAPAAGGGGAGGGF